jgi:hypothetical protein
MIEIEELCKILDIMVEEFKDYCSNKQNMLINEFRKWKKSK